MVTIQEKAKRQRNLIIVFLAVVFVTFLILYFGYFKKEKISPTEIMPEYFPLEKTLEIDWNILENPVFKELETFPEAEKLKAEEIGRENPFLTLK